MRSEDEQFQDWVGREQSSSNILTSAPMEGLAATLDRDDTRFAVGDAIPALWHWLYFLEPARQSEIAEDGHAKKGGFLPPIPLPRRMWAGSRLRFARPLRVGETITRRSSIKSVTIKQGRSGKLAFVCVVHELSDDSGIVLEEEHDIVYREMPPPNAAPASTKKSEARIDFARTITPSPALLFRYSALTFNAHRIHYDRDYAKNMEHYPGLVVHGPLLATMLLELFSDNYAEAVLSHFEFRALSPVIDNQPFQCCGSKLSEDGTSRLWIVDNAGNLCLEASATVANPS